MRFETKAEVNAEIKRLKEAAEHGPLNGKIAAGLVGFTTDDPLFICAKCANKILGRGCRLPAYAEPLWENQGKTLTGSCCVCK